MNTRGALRWLPLCLLICSTAALGCGDDDDDGAANGGDSGSSGKSGAGRGGSGGGAAAGKGASGSGGGAAAGKGASGSGGAGRAGAGQTGSGDDAGMPDKLNFFVTSDTSMTGDLGGLAGADERCQKLAAAVGAGDKTWHAYLSVEHAADGGGPVNARDRIGSGPWYNVKGVQLAKDLAELHGRDGDPEVFIDEHGDKINGQWSGSPMPNQHDVLTGSNADGTLLSGKTCKDWTSSSMADTAQVGHTDGLGPMQNPAPPYNSWNSVHENGGCNDTAPRGGAGKLYCFGL